MSLPLRHSRRLFLARAGKLGLAAGAVPLLAACAADDPAVAPTPSASRTPGPTAGATTTPPATASPASEATAIVGDVLDFSIEPGDWEGAFGFVRMRLRRALVDGEEAFFVRTDSSDADHAEREQLVFVPKLRSMTDLAGRMVLVRDGAEEQSPVLSTRPGRPDYSPAWTLVEAVFSGEPRLLQSMDDVDAAVEAGELTLDETGIVVNAGVISWADGSMPVDPELKAYLAGGQLIEPPDTQGGSVMFKLNQCYPESWYFALDHSLAGPAEATNTVYSPGLHAAPSEAGATGRTNVFMNGIEGPGPMGFQPSAFDWQAGTPDWSPYWDHFAYRWNDDATPRLLDSQTAVLEARDDGELEEFPGVPDTDGEVFTVNCPVPVTGPNTFRP